VLTLAVVSVLLTTTAFAVMWALCIRVKNYSFLDVTWTLSIGLLALLDGVLGSGNPMRRILYTLLALAWSLRLGLFVLARVLRHHPAEDKRYRSLRERWRGPAAWFAFFELQALIALVFSAPFLIAAFAGEQALTALEGCGLAIAGCGIVGEALADQQSQTFKHRRGAEQRILDVGLWRYSRHPNYFFEIVTWVGFAVAVLPLPDGWIALLCPVLIAYFLLRVTGVPLTEQHSLETHGDAYRDYQRRTSAVIPWPPKSTAS